MPGLKTPLWPAEIMAKFFEANVGKDTPIGLERGINAQWKDGGLIYSPPFR